MTPQLFIDLDGVLSDFDGHYEKLFGVRPNQDTYEPSNLWDNIRANKTFYRDQPMITDAEELWEGALEIHPNPIVLTGVPYSIPNVEAQKEAWVSEHLGPNVKVICCRSTDKCLHGKLADVLVDDRLKYSKFWKEMGGVFVLHTSAKASLQRLRWLYKGSSILGAI